MSCIVCLYPCVYIRVFLCAPVSCGHVYIQYISISMMVLVIWCFYECLCMFSFICMKINQPTALYYKISIYVEIVLIVTLLSFFKASWPLNIVITDGCINKYNQIFSFLLQLKHMVWTLRDVWFHLKRTGKSLSWKCSLCVWWWWSIFLLLLYIFLFFWAFVLDIFYVRI